MTEMFWQFVAQSALDELQQVKGQNNRLKWEIEMYQNAVKELSREIERLNNPTSKEATQCTK